jgi:hypothetical protein
MASRPNPAKAFSTKRVSRLVAVLFAGVLPVVPGFAAETSTPQSASAPIVWDLDNLKKIDGFEPSVLGTPTLVPLSDSSHVLATRFDGKTGGLIIPSNPLAGLSEFTIEILFSPDPDGQPEQRFFHAQDEGGRRALIELRLNKDGGWWLDTFLKPAATEGLTLIDPKKVHPTGQWYWVALRYDGKRMMSFVNAEKELEGEVRFEPMTKGQTSVGVRLNAVYWFKGAIREVRINRVALAPEKLQRFRD